jgi:hypothetical protein
MADLHIPLDQGRMLRERTNALLIGWPICISHSIKDGCCGADQGAAHRMADVAYPTRSRTDATGADQGAAHRMADVAIHLESLALFEMQ